MKDGGTQDDSLRVVIAAGNVVLSDRHVRFGKGDSDLLWGAEGSRIALIRTISEHTELYEAYDQKTGRFLRNETWHEGKRLEAGQPIRFMPKPRKKPYSDLKF